MKDCQRSSPRATSGKATVVMETNEVLKWALLYRRFGWNPLPTVRGEKRPFGGWIKYQNERVTEEEVRKWWTQAPAANIGTVTGGISGIVVIDIEKGGSTNGYPPTVTSRTGGGGWHLFYKHPGIPIKNSTKNIALLTDVRGDGGFIILPPSLHASGNKYEWVVSPEEADLAELPQDLLEKLVGAKKKTDWKEFPTTTVVEGERNNEAARYAGKLLHDLSPELWQTAGWESLRAWNRDVAKPPLEEKELRGTFESIATMQARSGNEKRRDFKPHPLSSNAVTACFADIQAEPIRWLWPERIALGKLTLIIGDPNVGKSLLTAAMAAVVSNGFLWPVDKTESPVGDVILISAEDDAADTIKPRLEAAEADNRRVHVLESIKEVSTDGTSVRRMFSLKQDLAALEEKLASIHGCKLVIVDPISAYLDDTDSHRNASVRGLLAPLAALAAKRKIAIVAIDHLNKNSNESNKLYRASGSLAFVAAARAVYIVTRDKDNVNRRLFMPIKNNIAKENTGLAYTVITAENNAPVIAWEPEPILITADEALGRSDSNEEKTKIEWAKQVLEVVLANGPVSSTDISREAKQAGISASTLNRAKEKLGIEPKKIGFKGGWVWSLPIHEDVQKGEDTVPESVGILGNDGHLGSANKSVLETEIRLEDIPFGSDAS